MLLVRTVDLDFRQGDQTPLEHASDAGQRGFDVFYCADGLDDSGQVSMEPQGAGGEHA